MTQVGQMTGKVAINVTPLVGKLSDVERQILYHITDEQADNGGAPVEVSLRGLRAVTKRNQRNVLRALKSLIADGYLTVTREQGVSEFTGNTYHKPNKYSVTNAY